MDHFEAQRDRFRIRWALDRGYTVEFAQRGFERDGVWRLSMDAEVNLATAPDVPSAAGATRSPRCVSPSFCC